MKKILIIFKIFLLSALIQSLYSYAHTLPSHSFSPLTEPHTARTLGKANNEVNLSLGILSKQFNLFNDFSKGLSVTSIEYTRGLSDHFDLAVFAEMQNLNILLGLAGMHQWIRHEQHTLSFLLSAGLNKNNNIFSMNLYTKEYDHKEYKKATEESLLGYFIYAGPVYSFKPNEKYELAFNIRINHSYSQIVNRTLLGNAIERGVQASAESIRKSLADNWLLNLLNPGLDKPMKPLPKKERIEKTSVHFLYGSANMSNTWWFTPSFGATVSLGVLYPFYINSKYHADLLLFKPSFNIHTRF